jgi:hypothetical protein
MHANGLRPARVAGWAEIIERQLCRMSHARVTGCAGIIEWQLSEIFFIFNIFKKTIFTFSTEFFLFYT